MTTWMTPVFTVGKIKQEIHEGVHNEWSKRTSRVCCWRRQGSKFRELRDTWLNTDVQPPNDHQLSTDLATFIREVLSVNPKGNQSWMFIGRSDAEAETPIIWLPDARNWLIEKDPDAQTDWWWEEKGTTQDEMVGWHYRFDRHEFE